jgi:hypothetical protein
MDNLDPHLKSSPYTKTSYSEELSAQIFDKLVNREFIRGNISTADKIPNIDALLTLLDQESRPIGDFYIQLKTLDRKNVNKPKFQCSKSLFAFAFESVIPVLLVVVDQSNEKAYWMHLTRNLYDSLNPKSQTKSVMLHLSTDQVLEDGKNNHLNVWEKIINDVKYKVHNFEYVKEQAEFSEKLFGGRNPRILPAYSIGESEFREINTFLDHLNNRFDNELRTIKEILYYDCWKLAIALTDYQAKQASFFILPLPINGNRPLILELAKGRRSADEIFHNEKALTLRMSSQANPIKTNPSSLALELLEKEVSKVIGKKDFDTESSFLAIEYLFSFARIFHSVLDLPKEPDTIDLDHLYKTLFVLLPISREIEWGPSQGKIMCYIDHLIQFRTDELKSIIERAEKGRNDGIKANPELTLISKFIDLNLVKYYIKMLQHLGYRQIDNPLKPMILQRHDAIYIWDTWLPEPMFDNLKKIFAELLSIYQKLIDDKFPLLKQELDFFDGESVIVYIFNPNFTDHSPYLHCIGFRSLEPEPKRQILLLHSESEQGKELINGIDSSDFWEKEFTLFGSKHLLRSSKGYNLNFLHQPRPTHWMINDTLSLRFKEYFNSEGKRQN